jgi:hypothetical protein
MTPRRPCRQCDGPPGRALGRTLAGYLLAATAVVACPCHVLLLWPLVLPLLASTALGGLLTSHPEWVLVGATAYFVAALLAAWRLLGERPADDSAPALPTAPGARGLGRLRPREGVDE